MRIELYVGIKIMEPARCFYCEKSLNSGQANMTERSEYYCSIECARQDYIFTLDGLEIIEASNMVQLAIKEKDNG